MIGRVTNIVKHWQLQLGCSSKPQQSPSTLRNWASVVKKSLHACERDDSKRAQWRQDIAALDINKLVFIDETSSYLDQSREYARAPLAERAVDQAPKGTKQRVSLLAAVSSQDLDPKHCLVHPGTVNKAAFTTYLRDILLPNLAPGSILVLDNWTVHKGADVRALVAQFQCTLLYLPTYSPDFNPIEFLFSKIKAYVKAIRPDKLLDLVDSFAQAVFTVTHHDVTNTFRHCKYLS